MWPNNYGKIVLMTKEVTLCEGAFEFLLEKYTKILLGFHGEFVFFCLTFWGDGITIVLIAVCVSDFLMLCAAIFSWICQ